VGTDVQQIVALARDYFMERTRALNSGSTRRLRSMSTPDCRCLAFAKSVEDSWAKGRVQAPGYYKIRQIARPTVTSSSAAFATAIYTTGSGKEFDSLGRVITTYAADDRIESASIDFTRVSGTWKVANVVRNVD